MLDLSSAGMRRRRRRRRREFNRKNESRIPCENPS
jgi:hypothetical protein